MKLLYLLSSVLVLLATATLLNAQNIWVIETNKSVSIRGLSVVNNKVAWLSSSRGYTAITLDGGLTWNWQQVKGFEKSDFRDIEAFSDKEAIIMSSGTPALILKTTDGGANWQLKYRNDDKAYFLDAMDFSNKKHGLILGDPIDKKFLLLETNDSGDSWHKFANQPDAEEGEAAFAASGTCLRIGDKEAVGFVTGGKISRLITTGPKNSNWVYTSLPVSQGKDSQGAFSLDRTVSLFVGGDYVSNKKSEGTAAYYDTTSGIAYKQSSIPSGYQSCVENIGPETYFSTGTSGSNLTKDNGHTWHQIDTNSFNVCRKAKRGKLVLLAGDKGKIGILTL
ncbi:WD40/YVTN/BNR-like repeat-containing protein [Mucilaginibacter calamicampi]|uniref:WD40/YVTN/BNR-like repeat-containing protein n=1 Tax=Mucilaginibacter calamicampi TaxID=1302352 RepID=A0ABW2YTB1_9SPHI